jgi:hypothetical protein
MLLQILMTGVGFDRVGFAFMTFVRLQRPTLLQRGFVLGFRDGRRCLGVIVIPFLRSTSSA